MANPGLWYAWSSAFSGWESYAQPLAHVYSASTLHWIVEERPGIPGSVVLIHDSSMFVGEWYDNGWDLVPDMNFLFVHNLCTIFPQ